MSYCVNCGVELAGSEKKCPLCGVEVNNPLHPYDKSAEKPYPDYYRRTPVRISRKVRLEFTTLIFLIPIAISVVCNFSLSGNLSWAGYVIGALILIYLCFISPIVASGVRKRSMSVVMTGIVFAAVGVYLYYIERHAGGSWFFPFVLPLVISVAIVVLFMMTVVLFLQPKPLMHTALGLLLAGVECVVIETLINSAFAVSNRFVWSLYPLTAMVIIGIILIYIDCKPALKEKLRKKLFI